MNQQLQPRQEKPYQAMPKTGEKQVKRGPESLQLSMRSIHAKKSSEQ